MGFTLDIGIPAVAVFAQGLLSFFSPCVLPLLPLYIGYLSGGAVVSEGETPRFHRGRAAVNTIFFVLGISFAFFLLGLGMSAIGAFFGSKQRLFARVGGIIVILFGLYQLGVFGEVGSLQRERRLPLPLDRMAMSPLTAFLMGFVFSFAWTPCVGPVLSSVLLMAASATSRTLGFALIGVYTLGFVIPFLATGVFAVSLLDVFRKHAGVVRWTVKIGGVLMCLMGVLMIMGLMNNVSGFFAGLSDPGDNAAGEAVAESIGEAEPAQTPTSEPKEEDTRDEAEPASVPAPDFTLYDQYGNLHTLSDYQGQVVFLNFWATWCPPCRAEMPEIEQLYEKYADPDSGVVILGVAFPNFGRETDAEGVASFLEENGYYYPVLMDTDAELIYSYGIMAYPTTFMIAADGSVYGYLTGAMDLETMESIVRQTIEGGAK